MGRKRAAGEDYESDDGFVEDAPQTKKTKSTAKSTSRVLEKHKDDDGNAYWELSSLRRVQISEFKGKTFVGIREFYEKDGKTLPGKKGISLSIEQFNTVIDLLPQLEAELVKGGHSIDRPIYDQSEPDGERDESKYDFDDGSEAPIKAGSSKASLKANHEATSDEDDD